MGLWGLWGEGLQRCPGLLGSRDAGRFKGGGVGHRDSADSRAPSAPTEGDVSRAVAPLLHQWLVKLSAGSRVDAGPAVLAVVLQAGDVGTEEGGELPPTASPLALIAHLVVQNVRLHLHLGRRRTRGRI